jgi:hypothetical protein
MEESVDVPAGHKSILRRNCDHSRHVIGVLAVGRQPGDRLRVVSPDVLDGHRVLAVEITAVQDFE